MDPQQEMYGEDYEGDDDGEYDLEPLDGYEEIEEDEQQQQQQQQQPQQYQQQTAPPADWSAPPPTDPDACTCAPCDCTCDVKKDYDEFGGEGDGTCTCNPCECETPPGSREKSTTVISDVEAEEEMEDLEDATPFQLDEFTRAKAFFMNTSTKSGISLYDHLSDVIRKLLDERAPTNPVDFIEEISMNVKRYRFQQPKDVLQDVFYISEPVLNNARYLNDNWKTYSQWYEEGKENPGEGFVAGSFSNLLRLQYYTEQVNLGLPREEMFRLALAIKDLTAARPYITKARFWGKVFGLRKNYYVVEVDMNGAGSGDADLWQPEEEPLEPPVPEPDALPRTSGGGGDANPDNSVVEEKAPSAGETFEKAGNVVLNSDVLAAYSQSSGLPPDEQAALLPKTPGGPPTAQTEEWGGEDGMGAYKVPPPTDGQEEFGADNAKWAEYKAELMTKFPVPAPLEEEIEIPAEPNGTGINRRAFYICNYLGQPWILLPPTTPKQINGARQIRWGLTGELEGRIRSVPQFQGKEGHFLKVLLSRASAGSLVSPKGFYRGNSYPSEYDGEDEEDIEEEEESSNDPGDDKVIAVKKYRPSMDALINPELSFWVHHACPILPQGRNVWWNPSRNKAKQRNDEETEDEDEEDEGEEYDGEDANMPTREVGPPLFSPINKDEAADGRAAWTLVKSSSVFKDFQVVSVRSNTWPGSNVICTVKGKVDNLYLGDGQKFGERCYAPFMSEPIMREYIMGPEMREEFPDPPVDEEQKFLANLEADELEDIEPKFVDNEEGYEYGGEGESDEN